MLQYDIEIPCAGGKIARSAFASARIHKQNAKIFKMGLTTASLIRKIRRFVSILQLKEK